MENGEEAKRFAWIAACDKYLAEREPSMEAADRETLATALWERDNERRRSPLAASGSIAHEQIYRIRRLLADHRERRKESSDKESVDGYSAGSVH